MTAVEDDRRAHWERVYSTKRAEATSWYQAKPTASLSLIERSGVAPDAPLIDVGGGASLLVDCLLDRGFSDLTVLDISASSLRQARSRLGERAARVNWRVEDVTRFDPDRVYALWHDRAVFHFLTEATDRAAYLSRLDRSLAAGGQAVIAAFAPDGPKRCSGLDIVRYDAVALGAELGEAFELREAFLESHVTPAGTEQRFGFYRFRKVA